MEPGPRDVQESRCTTFPQEGYRRFHGHQGAGRGIDGQETWLEARSSWALGIRVPSLGMGRRGSLEAFVM